MVSPQHLVVSDIRSQSQIAAGYIGVNLLTLLSQPIKILVPLVESITPMGMTLV